MKKPVLALVAVLAVGAVAAVLWLVGGDGDAPPELARLASREEAPAPASDAAKIAAPTEEHEERSDEELAASSARVAADDAVAAWNPERTRWLAGVVALPDGLPHDEEARVYAAAAGRFEPGSDDLTDAVHAHLDRGREPSAQGLVASAAIEPDGSFRLGLPPEGDAFELVVHGRYLFTHPRELARVGPQDEDVVLRPALGTWVRGRVRPPPGYAVEGLEGAELELEPDAFSLMGFPGGGSVEGREVRAAADGTFEVLGVVPGVSYTVACAPEDLAAEVSERFAAEPGRRADVALALTAGGALAGAVRDEAGRGVSGAHVEVRQGGNLMYGQRGRLVREGETDGEGRFVLAAVAPGRSTVRAEARRYLEVMTDVTVPEAGRVDGVELVLSEGATVAGEVRWPGGSPAAGAEVDLGFDMNLLGGMEALNMFRGAEGEAKTDAAGRFAIRGLGKGPFAVRVEAYPPAATEEEREAGLVPRWVARADGVAPDTTDLVLELTEPLVLRGRVVDATGAPVTDFAVHAAEITQAMIPGVGADRVDDRFEDGEGRFLLTGLHAGEWNVSAVAEGYAVPSAVEVTVPQPDGAELELLLEPGASVSGVVLDPSNRPVAGARVSLEFTLASLRDMTRSFARRPEATTAADGTFRLEQLTPGGNALVAIAEGHAQSEAVHVEPESGVHVEDVVLVLRVGARLTGEVYGDDGELAEGVQVIAQVPGSISPRSARTDGRGFFELEHLVPASYQVIAMVSREPSGDAEDGGLSDIFRSMKFTSAELADGEETHVVLGAPPEDPVLVEGRVLCGGEEQAGVSVTFMPDGGGGGMGAMKFTTTDGEGRYSTQLEQPGKYLLSVQRLAAMNGQNTWATNVEVPEVETWEHDVELPLGGIRGRVRTPDGTPAAGVRVSLNNEGPVDSGTILGSRYTELATDGEGRFSIEWMPPGSYTVAVGGAPMGGLLGGESAWGRQARRGVEVPEGRWVGGIDFRLREPARIEGRVRDASGRPVAEASIFVRDENGLPVERLSMIQTDGSGRFVYRGLNPGEYTVLARQGALVSAESPPVRAVEEGASTVELVIDEGAYLVVQLEDRSGEPLQASVTVTDHLGRQVNGVLSMPELLDAFNKGFSTTEQRVGPLPPGDYRVEAFARDGRDASKPVSLRPGTERRLKLRLRD